MRICAARLDPGTSADEFIDLLDTLVEWCIETGRKHPGEAEPPSVPLLGTAEGQARKILTDPDDEPTAGASPSAAPPGRKLSYDDKVRLRAEHEAHLEERRAGGYKNAAPGVAERLMLKYGLSNKQQVYDIIRHAGD